MDLFPIGNILAIGCVLMIARLRIVVAGDNLRIPLLGEFLQGAGAFYIRRAWGDDALYATVVQAYIDILLSKGYNFECFIEGTRSRTGIHAFISYLTHRETLSSESRYAQITL
jgi:glycerol-3-phosphate O-acyltransferase